MQERGAEAPAVRDSARRKRGEQKSEQAAVQITTIVSLTEATEGSKKCPVKASRRRSSNGSSLLLTAYGPGRICSEARSDAPGKGGTPVRGIIAAAVVSFQRVPACRRTDASGPDTVSMTGFGKGSNR